MTTLNLHDVHVTIAGTPIITGVDLTAPSGRRVGIIGPNGSGKSTLLRAVYRHLPLAQGTITVDGEDLWRLTPRRAAQLVAALPQETRSDFDVTAWEMAAMGRTPHKRPFAPDTAEDTTIVADALTHAGVAHLAHRHYTTLSGGEKQRVLRARALAQQAPVLVLDEPTNHLDVRHQFELLRAPQGLSSRGRGALVCMGILGLVRGLAHREGTWPSAGPARGSGRLGSYAVWARLVKIQVSGPLSGQGRGIWCVLAMESGG
ncbi:ABC transporter ATP-binding protein [Nonomuraea sp. K274]|uniref:ABC transporter ATP-binding protein n=1 Tax=Nonomuraea cypriaca TaxID=1187855 RepID=A0A931A6Y4_9ACTN|nr:ABC transporter ATP-binding protein [Nonomuraea cypriaca]MBF8187512.1 ABC transporter ATP-binding protein [Nonomuraea cypriaca]